MEITIENLPRELLIACFSYLDLKNIGRLLSVCKTFQEALQSDYAKLIYGKLAITDSDLKSVFFHAGTKTLSLRQQLAQKLPKETVSLSLIQLIQQIPAKNALPIIKLWSEAKPVLDQKKSVDKEIEILDNALVSIEDSLPWVQSFKQNTYKLLIPLSIYGFYLSYERKDIRGMYYSLIFLVSATMSMIYFHNKAPLNNSAANYSARIEDLESNTAELTKELDQESNFFKKNK